jgi:hypothetical protein
MDAGNGITCEAGCRIWKRMIVASASAAMLYVSGSVRSMCFFVASWWPLTYCRFISGRVFSSSASCMIMSESDLSQKPVGMYSEVARRRRVSRLALSVWMVLEMLVWCCLVSSRMRQIPARRP